MDHFQFRGGVMHAEDVSLEMLAADVGTPFYCYSSATIERHYTVFRDAVAGLGSGDPLVAFAVKSNPNLAVLATVARLGAGADVVSGGELARALAAGMLYLSAGSDTTFLLSGAREQARALRATQVCLSSSEVQHVPFVLCYSAVVSLRR
jgi:diaminopimelate decarboxylase